MALAVDDRGVYVLPTPAARQYDTSSIDRRLLRPLPWARRHTFFEDWSGIWIGYVIAALAAVSIIGWWPGKLRRAAWFIGLWLVPWFLIEAVRFVLDAREMGPGEHYDWSTFWTLSMEDFRILMGIFIAVVQVWWLMRIVRWCWKQAVARMVRARKPIAAQTRP
jgi:hypothetical protein